MPKVPLQKIAPQTLKKSGYSERDIALAVLLLETEVGMNNNDPNMVYALIREKFKQAEEMMRYEYKRLYKPAPAPIAKGKATMKATLTVTEKDE